jgi:hypothetical protein
MAFAVRGAKWRPEKAPNFKHQAPEKFQTSSSNATARQPGWILVLGASLELGCWSLEFISVA